MTNPSHATARASSRRLLTRGRLLLAATLAAAAPVALGSALPSGAATTPTMHVLADNALATLPPGARIMGGASRAIPLPLDVTLTVQHPATLATMLAGLDNPQSPYFHHYLARGAFARRFGASASELGAVETWLRSVGLTPTGVSGNHLTIHARGTVGVASRAFRTSFDAVALGARRAVMNVVAPSVPASIAGDVQGVIGLDTLPAVHSDLARATVGAATHPRTAGHASGPVACGSLALAAKYQDSFTAGGLASYYAMSAIYSLGDEGQGVHVAVAEFEPDLRSDIASFEHCYKATTATNYVHIDGGTGMAPGPGSGESALDIENVISLAPKSTIDIYQTPNTDMGSDDMYAQMVSTDVDKVITTSWGSCEPHTDTTVLDSEEVTFAQANLQGQVMFAAAGDSGSEDCYGDMTGSDQSTPEVDDPGSQPYVLSVGGTSATTHVESVWNADGSGGGGGISQVHCMPSYQDNVAIPNLINLNSTPDTVACPSGYFREVPDVTAMADPETGYTIYYDGQLTAIGGTSGAAPLWAGASALVLASPYCTADHATVGVSPESLYGLAATTGYGHGLRDITQGNNAIPQSGYAGDLYPALRGYDEASGLGSPLLTYGSTLAARLFEPGLASLLCHSNGTADPTPVVTRVVPTSVASNLPTTVTIMGTGFLPIAGADRVEVQGHAFTATCTTSTRCTVALDNLTPRTSDLRVLDQTYAESPVSAADEVTVLAAPKVTSLSPGKGPTKGKTRVMILGTGFTGRVSVQFGTRAATQVSVVSATKLVVTAPAGSGSVYVRVAASGGLSARSPSGIFRY